MSQIGFSRPPSQVGSQQKIGISLPQIPHPLSRMQSPGNMDIRGVSRSGDRPFSQNQTGRPLTTENPHAARKIYTSGGRSTRQSSKRQLSKSANYEAIPEGVEVVEGDLTKTRLPIFGNRAEVASRADVESRVASRLSRASTQARIEIDALEMMLRDRVPNSYFDLTKRFKDNDPEGKGNVTREGLLRILERFLLKEIMLYQFNRLMDRFGMKDKTIISYSEFFSIFKDAPESEFPRWMDPVHRHWQDKVTMTASQVHCQLKEKARQRFLDVADLIPQLNPGGTGRILKPEFRNMLNKLLFFMDDDEFEKLWQKYDVDGVGTINGEKFLNKLGITLREATANAGKRSSPIEDTGHVHKTPKKNEVARQQSLDIERWLQTKFREGCMQMKEAFERYDQAGLGIVTFDDFLKVLAEFGLNLEKNRLSEFLARCVVKPKPEGVPYKQFLYRVQDRSDKGMTHNIMSKQKRRANGPQSIMGDMETRLMEIFQSDFLGLLGSFKNIDKLKQDVISQEEFRAAVEARFDLGLTDNQYRNVVDHLPLDEDGNVQYALFMRQFDAKNAAPSILGLDSPAPATVKKVPHAPLESMSPVPMDVDRLVINHAESGQEDGYIGCRGTQELTLLIKDLMFRKFSEVEQAYYEIDDMNTRRLTQETMYQLLKRFDINPEIKRREISDLWPTFIINSDKTLEYLEFVRHFGFSMRAATFPNAKRSPPKRGDADCMMRSRKLNCAADMLQDSLRSKINFLWDDICKQFTLLDPIGTGCVTTDDFSAVLTELCVNLSDYELKVLCKKFAVGDDRITYVEFLKPFAMRRQLWRYGNNMLSLLQHPVSELPINDIVEPPQRGLYGISAKLRQMLSGDWKNLRRAFKKLDTTNDGYLSIPEFRSVLKLANLVLDEDEVYHVLNEFDENLSGKISYDKFINETFKPKSRQSQSRLQ